MVKYIARPSEQRLSDDTVRRRGKTNSAHPSVTIYSSCSSSSPDQTEFQQDLSSSPPLVSATTFPATFFRESPSPQPQPIDGPPPSYEIRLARGSPSPSPRPGRLFLPFKPQTPASTSASRRNPLHLATPSPSSSFSRRVHCRGRVPPGIIFALFCVEPSPWVYRKSPRPVRSTWRLSCISRAASSPCVPEQRD